MDIRVSVRTVDHHHESRRFKTVDGARRYAQRWVGEHPDVAEVSAYAVSQDGVVVVRVRGLTLGELFPGWSREPQAGDGRGGEP